MTALVSLQLSAENGRIDNETESEQTRPKASTTQRPRGSDQCYKTTQGPVLHNGQDAISEQAFIGTSQKKSHVVPRTSHMTVMGPLYVNTEAFIECVLIVGSIDISVHDTPSVSTQHRQTNCCLIVRIIDMARGLRSNYSHLLQ